LLQSKVKGHPAVDAAPTRIPPICRRGEVRTEHPPGPGRCGD
jgi:hypothetical protein